MESFRSRSRLLALQLKRGVTLIELLVVLAIITIIAAVVITSQATFNKTLILANTAYDVALTIRSAQTYGIGSRVASGVSNNNISYGVNFQKSSSKNFIFFGDTDNSLGSCHGSAIAGETAAPDVASGDCIYTEGSDKDEKVSTYALGNGMSIDNICAYKSTWKCTKTNDFASLNITFARPNTQTFIVMDSLNASNAQASRACIVIASPQGTTRLIYVEPSGAITVSVGNTCI